MTHLNVLVTAAPQQVYAGTLNVMYDISLVKLKCTMPDQAESG